MRNDLIENRLRKFYADNALDFSRQLVQKRADADNPKLSSGVRNTAWSAALRLEGQIQRQAQLIAESHARGCH